MSVRSFNILGYAILLFFGCKRKEMAEWPLNVLTPLVQTELGLNDLVADSMLISNTDGSYNLVYDYEQLLDSFGDYLEIPDTISSVSMSLNKLILEDRNMVDTIPLKEIMPASVFLDGKMVQLEAQDITNSSGKQEIDISEAFFRKAKFLKGQMEISIYNDLPVEIELIIFKLSNKNNGTIIALDTFFNVKPGNSDYKLISLAGKEIDGILIGELIRVKTLESPGPVLIESNKGIRVELKVTGLEPEYATAIFPSQNLIENSEEVTYNFKGPQITVLKIRTGFVKMKVINTIQERIILTYKLPNSRYDDQPNTAVVLELIVPAASPGKPTFVEKLFPINKYVIDYNGKDRILPPHFNTIYSELSARMEASGIERNLSLGDSVFIQFGMVDIVPEFVIGDFGLKTFSINESNPIPAFKNINGTISLEDINVILSFENTFGIEANIDIIEINGFNSRTGKSARIISSELDQTINLKRAYSLPLRPAFNIKKLTPTNSTVKTFVENLSDVIYTKFNITSRPYGSKDFTDFVFQDSYLKAKLSLNMPVTFGAEGLQLTQKKSWKPVTPDGQFKKIKTGNLKLWISNEFPLAAKIQIEFLDSKGAILTTLFQDGNWGEVIAADVSTGAGRTTGSSSTLIPVNVNETKMKLIKSSINYSVKVIFDTPGSLRYKIFNTYKMKVKITGDFVYDQSL
jgi:hypothetical protein